MSESFKYDQRGVSATKDEVHAAIKNLDKGLYPKAFCKILPDISGGDPAYCNLMHADTAGTKTSLAYLYWKETGDLSVWEGIAQDAIIMNLDDMGCVGCLDDIILSSTIGRNKNLIPGDVISTIINATVKLADQLGEYGIKVHLAGGETADVGDIVRTIDVGYTAFGRLKREDLIVNNIQAGDVIVGMASYGKSSYERQYNGGMGSNGLTSARHDVFEAEYRDKYPDSYDANTPRDLIYAGSKKLTDTIDIDGESIPIGKLVLSPTRTYLPVLKVLIDELKPKIHGLIHCTGGGQTKVGKFIDNKRVIKHQLLPIPPLFQMIQQESETGWKEMYQVFNMGHRMEVYLPEAEAERVISIAQSFNIDAQVVGHVEQHTGNSVRIDSPYGQFDYDFD
ncbi:MAG: phosphoribosylformylglycinamidine cyclo-ligase [Saprospiraceae bacterium]|nr:phosphoribosylformylglycinamidine cyclo-ligase [Saprospiraceae bacterium]